MRSSTAQPEKKHIAKLETCDRSRLTNNSNYQTNRYNCDFKQLRLLGKGGFGEVFEAKHYIDGHHYAVKRILLPEK